MQPDCFAVLRSSAFEIAFLFQYLASFECFFGGRRQELIQPLAEFFLRFKALEVSHRLALMNGRNKRNRLHPKRLRDWRVGLIFNIDLGQDKPTVVLDRQLLNDRSQLFTRPAP